MLRIVHISDLHVVSPRGVEVTVVPGNHDVYLPSVHAERRFPTHFGAFVRSELRALARDLRDGRTLDRLSLPAQLEGA